MIVLQLQTEDWAEIDFVLDVLRKGEDAHEQEITLVLVSSVFTWGAGAGDGEKDYEKREPKIAL